jgi:hypothetical protein
MEDVPRLAEWMATIPWFEPINRAQLIIALILLIGLACLAAYAAHQGSRFGIYFFIWVQSFIFMHGIAHLIPSLWLLAYTPGIVTGGILIPVSLYLIRRAREECGISWKMFAAIFVLAILLYDPVLRVAFEVGGLVSRPQSNEFEPGPPLQPVVKTGVPDQDFSVHRV